MQILIGVMHSFQRRLPNGNTGLGRGPGYCLTAGRTMLYGPGEMSRVRTEEGKAMGMRKDVSTTPYPELTCHFCSESIPNRF